MSGSARADPHLGARDSASDLEASAMVPWVFVRVPYMNPTFGGFLGPGCLNQVPTLLSLADKKPICL